METQTVKIVYEEIYIDMGRSAVDQEPQRTPYKQTESGCEYSNF